jgi:threonylcarbamoyladenosine tRNA methylthiotransferase MtaB
MAAVVPMEVRRERNERLRILSQKKKYHFVQPFYGQKMEVLWEHSGNPGIMTGYTPNFIKVSAPFNPDKINTLEDVVLGEYQVAEDVFSLAFG